MMKNSIFTLFLMFSSFIFAQNTFVEGEIIIKIKKEYLNAAAANLAEKTLGIASLDKLNRNNGLQHMMAIGQFKITRTMLLTFPTNKSALELTRIYAKDPSIEFAETNLIAEGGGKLLPPPLPLATIPNDTNFTPNQWGLFNNGSFSVSGMNMAVTPDADVDMELAWDIQKGDPNMIIAVPDSGVNMTHTDIAARIWTKDSEPIDGIDNDGNGLVDDYRGWDWVNNDNNPTDDIGHGTNCTGIIGAISNNAQGYAGANWNSKMMVLKVLNSSNSATSAAMYSSLYYAVDNGAKIISFSIGGTGTNQAYVDVMNYINSHNVLLVACMMNFNNNTPYYPAAFSTTYPNVIAVGSTDANDKRTAPFFWSATSGSNYGPHISVVAPGNYIYGLNYNNNGFGSYWGGTSQATPLVAAVASLVWAQKPTLTPAQVRGVIQNTAEDMKGLLTEDVAGFDPYHGWGRVNAYAALQSVLLGTGEVSATAAEITVENPVAQNLIRYQSGREYKGMMINLMNLEGRLISRQKMNINKGNGVIEIKKIPSGNYMLVFANDSFRKVVKITVK